MCSPLIRLHASCGAKVTAVAELNRCCETWPSSKCFTALTTRRAPQARTALSNAAPFGGSIRDAAYIKTLEGGVIDPWNYVVAILVCLTITTDEQGTGATTVNTRASRCPNDAGEAETGLDLFTSTSDGRIRRTFSQVFTVRARATPSPSLLGP